MEHMVWTTESVAERERFAFWREAVVAGVLGAVGDPTSLSDPRFRAHAALWRGTAVRLRCQATAYHGRRGPREIARQSWDGYWIHREIGGSCWYDIAGRELVTQRGDLTVTDGALPFASQPRGERGFDFDVWFVPRAMIEPHLPARGGPPLSLTIPAGSGLQALTTSYLDSLGERLGALSSTEADQAADILCRLASIACRTAIPEQRDAVRAARLEQIKHYVDRHLTEMDLTPASVAAALGMSVRSLHLAFEPTGISFTEHVMKRRMQECRAALERSVAARSITDVAFAWGFANLTTFYRAFRREFGMAPGDLRRAGA